MLVKEGLGVLVELHHSVLVERRHFVLLESVFILALLLAHLAIVLVLAENLH